MKKLVWFLMGLFFSVSGCALHKKVDVVDVNDPWFSGYVFKFYDTDVKNVMCYVYMTDRTSAMSCLKVDHPVSHHKKK